GGDQQRRHERVVLQVGGDVQVLRVVLEGEQLTGGSAPSDSQPAAVRSLRPFSDQHMLVRVELRQPVAERLVAAVHHQQVQGVRADSAGKRLEQGVVQGGS